MTEMFKDVQVGMTRKVSIIKVDFSKTGEEWANVMYPHYSRFQRAINSLEEVSKEELITYYNMLIAVRINEILGNKTYLDKNTKRQAVAPSPLHHVISMIGEVILDQPFIRFVPSEFELKIDNDFVRQMTQKLIEYSEVGFTHVDNNFPNSQEGDKGFMSMTHIDEVLMSINKEVINQSIVFSAVSKQTRSLEIFDTFKYGESEEYANAVSNILYKAYVPKFR